MAQGRRVKATERSIRQGGHDTFLCVSKKELTLPEAEVVEFTCAVNCFGVLDLVDFVFAVARFREGERRLNKVSSLCCLFWVFTV